MQTTISQNSLKKAVTIASHFVSNKQQLPILSNILIKTLDSKLFISSTNLENSVTIALPAKVDSLGEIAVSGKLLSDLIINVKESNIDLKTDKEQLEIITSKFKSNILGVNTSDFPKIPDSIPSDSIKLDKNKLLASLSKILFSVSNDDTRPVLTGVLLSVLDQKMTLVSTDTFRLTEVVLEGKINCPDFKVIIPKAILNEIIKIEDESEIDFYFDQKNSQVIFKLGDIIFTSRTIDGNFPDYQKIIPVNIVAKYFIDKNEFDQSIKLASIFARDNGNIVKLKFENNKLEIKAESSNSGTQQSEIEVRIDESIKTYEGEIMFNFRFIDELLKVIESDEVEIQISGQNTACKFLDPKNTNFLHLIMPIKSQS